MYLNSASAQRGIRLQTLPMHNLRGHLACRSCFAPVLPIDEPFQETAQGNHLVLDAVSCL